MVLHEVDMSGNGGVKPVASSDKSERPSLYSAHPRKDPGEMNIRDRLPLWRAISSLWLERVLNDAEVRSIARILADSRYDWLELQRIYLYEVAPVVHANLRAGHGVWEAFDTRWLQKEIMKNMLNPQHTRAALKNREYLTEFVAGDWERIKKYVHDIRRNRRMSPAEQRGIITLLKSLERKSY